MFLTYAKVKQSSLYSGFGLGAKRNYLWFYFDLDCDSSLDIIRFLFMKVIVNCLMLDLYRDTMNRIIVRLYSDFKVLYV